MADAVSRAPSDTTVTVEVAGSTNGLPETNSEPVLRLKLKKPKNKKKVGWTTDTIDNEHMNKMKSKCCCIYEKPHKFGESSSDTDDECDHCRGHTEKKSGDSDPQIQPSTAS
ncbi:unnamed protein product [Allacma fusca]|uniref:E3 ubiquitin-protein ligase PPP1R11 n=1 Tax=Allacma fusca TaxID=39272 RepID=A0A8J2PU58_9HEXA|nr:unnamed protein product [Allacma fusca]